MIASLVTPDAPAVLWAFIAIGTASAIWAEQRFRWAARLSAPVIALLIAMTLSTTGVLPTAAPAYDFVGTWLVPLAIPLLLVRANLAEIVRTGGRVFLIFHLSATGTIAGTFAAIFFFGSAVESPDLEHAAGMMSASYMGGGVNFVAVKSSFEVAPEVTNTLIVADNFVMATMFIVLLSIGSSAWARRLYPHRESYGEGGEGEKNLAAAHWKRKEISLLDVARSFAYAFAALALAELLGRATGSLFPAADGQGLAATMLRELATNKYVLITVVSLGLATALAKPLKNLNGPEEFGAYLLALFLFTLGLPADLKTVLTGAPLFFLFCGTIAVTNLAFTLAAGKILRLNLEEMLIAVNATVGGPPTAAAMAISAGWPRLVLPGIVVGIWGYVIGTPLGILVANLLLQPS